MVFDADSEYRIEKIVRRVSRELWPIFVFFRIVTVFESTPTPLKVELLQNFFRVMISVKPKLLEYIDQIFQNDVQIRQFSI